VGARQEVAARAQITGAVGAVSGKMDGGARGGEELSEPAGTIGPGTAEGAESDGEGRGRKAERAAAVGREAGFGEELGRAHRAAMQASARRDLEELEGGTLALEPAARSPLALTRGGPGVPGEPHRQPR